MKKINNFINFIRALLRVYGFEIRLFVKEAYVPYLRYYIIEDTTRIQRLRLYHKAYNEIGYCKGKKLLKHLLKENNLKINIYESVLGHRTFLFEYKGD